MQKKKRKSSEHYMTASLFKQSFGPQHAPEVTMFSNIILPDRSEHGFILTR